MEEIWKDIEGYNGLYQVSNMGRVKSIDHYASNGQKIILYKGKIRKQNVHNGYLYVELSKNNVANTRLVHRLVARAFIENPNCYNTINHIDGNKLNNNYKNLEWCTQRQNVNHAVDTGLRHLKIPKEKFDYIYNEHKNGRGYGNIAKEFGVGKTRIVQIVRRVQNERL